MANFWLVCHPDIDKPIGGVKQIHRLAECLTSLGHKATLIQDTASFRPRWFKSDVSTIGFKDFAQSGSIHPNNDIFILPETYVSVFTSYIPGFKKIIFNQNSAYTFGGATKFIDPRLARNYYQHSEIVGVLCVSYYDQKAISSLIGDGKPILRIANSIDINLFKPGERKHKHIVYMPRKNSADSSVVHHAICRSQSFAGWKLQALHGLTSEEVAQHFQKSAVFLSFGHPEGFGLPVAEALACGCAVIGYSGLGGRELFALGSCYGVAEEIDFGDLMSFEPAFRRIDQQITDNSADFRSRTLQVSEVIRNTYSMEQMRITVEDALRVMDISA